MFDENSCIRATEKVERFKTLH